MFTVDCQTHVFPRAYAELLLEAGGWVRAARSNGTYTVRYGDIQSFRLEPEVYDVRHKLREMDKAAVDFGVISVNIPGPEVLAEDRTVQAARLCNDSVAELCARHADRFVGLAVLPWQDASAACEEMKRATGELGLRGVVLYSHIGGKPVDSPEFEPVYALAEEIGTPLVLHPTVPTWGAVLKEYSMIPMMGLMVDTSIAMLRLILSGLLDSYPSLQIIHPHCGGVLPYLMPRVVEQTEVKRRGRERINRSPAEYYSRVYIDLVSPSTLAMKYAYDHSGPDKLLFGSDHPWVSYEAILSCVKGMRISKADKAKILGENARKLFRIR